MVRTVVLTQYRRVTDGRTDGIAVALAMRRAVKNIGYFTVIRITQGQGKCHHLTERIQLPIRLCVYFVSFSRSVHQSIWLRRLGDLIGNSPKGWRDEVLAVLTEIRLVTDTQTDNTIDREFVTSGKKIREF